MNLHRPLKAVQSSISLPSSSASYIAPSILLRKRHRHTNHQWPRSWTTAAERPPSGARRHRDLAPAHKANSRFFGWSNVRRAHHGQGKDTSAHFVSPRVHPHTATPAVTSEADAGGFSLMPLSGIPSPLYTPVDPRMPSHPPHAATEELHNPRHGGGASVISPHGMLTNGSANGRLSSPQPYDNGYGYAPEPHRAFFSPRPDLGSHRSGIFSPDPICMEEHHHPPGHLVTNTAGLRVP